MSGVAGNEGVIALGLSGFAFILEIVTLAVPYGVQSSGCVIRFFWRFSLQVDSEKRE
jgi:hypothetical protein